MSDTSLLFVCCTTLRFPGISSIRLKQYHISVDSGGDFLFSWRSFLPSLLSNLTRMTYWVLSCCFLSGISVLNWYDKYFGLIVDITGYLRRTNVCILVPFFLYGLFLSRSLSLTHRQTQAFNNTRLFENAGGPTDDRYAALWFAVLPIILNMVFFSPDFSWLATGSWLFKCYVKFNKTELFVNTKTLTNHTVSFSHTMTTM